MRRLLLAFFLFPLVAGSAQGQAPAQTPSVTFLAAEPPELLVPEEGVARSNLTFRMSCPLPPGIVPYQVTFAVKETATYATVILNPPSSSLAFAFERCPQPGYTEVTTADAIMTTNRQAPAYRTFETTITATASDRDRTFGPYEARFNVTNDYLPLTVVNPDRLFLKVAPGERARFTVEVQNLGNGATRSQLGIESQRGAQIKSIEVGPELVLESRVQQGPGAEFKRSIVVEVLTKNQGVYVNEVASFNLNVTTRSAERNDSVTDSQTLGFAVQVQGGAAAAPAPTTGLMLAMVATAVFVHELRKRIP